MARLGEGSGIVIEQKRLVQGKIVVPGLQGPQGDVGPQGDQGIPGTPGENFNILEPVADAASLPTVGNEDGDGRLAEDTGHMWVWNGGAEAWIDSGQWRGDTGAPGGSDASFAGWIDDDTTPSLTRAAFDAALVEEDADAASPFRVQSDARLSATYVRMFRPDQFTGTNIEKIQAAIDAASTAAVAANGLALVRLDGTWALGATDRIKPRTGVHIQHGIIDSTATASGVFMIETNVTDWAILDVTINAPTAAYAINADQTGVARGRIARCSFTGTTNYAVNLQDHATDITVEDCDFSDVISAMRCRANCKRITFSNNRVTDWLVYGIEIRGVEAVGAPDVVRCYNNHFTAPTAGETGLAGVAKQAIVVLGHSSLYSTNIHIDGNTCVGPGTPSIIGTVNNATGDQFVLQHVDGFAFTNNTSTLGGENGASITHNCRNGVVDGNIISDNDAHGLEIGIPSSTPISQGITVTGNLIYNNALDDELGTHQFANIWVVNAKGVTVVGNQCYDDNAQIQWGVLVGTSTDVTVALNDTRGCLTSVTGAASQFRTLITMNEAKFGNGLGAPTAILNGAAGQRRQFAMQTAGVPRWRIAADGAVEGGSNAGSNLLIERMDDAGGIIGNAIHITRSTGKVQIATDLQVDGLLTAHAHAVKASGQVVNNTTTLAAITTLTAALVANATYEFTFTLIYDAADTADIKVHPTIPASTTIDWQAAGPATNMVAGGQAANTVFSYNDASTASRAMGAAGVGTKLVARVLGYVTTAGTAGNLGLEFAQNVADVSDATVYAGSRLVVRRIA